MKITRITKKKTKDLPSQIEMYRSIRKKQPPATKVIPDKSKYDRKDKDWKKDVESSK